MYSSKFVSLIFIIAFSILFSGCSNVIDWGKYTFNQGCKVNDSVASVARTFIRTGRVYDQFTTLGIFDAMWLTPDVIKAYVDLHSEKFILSEKEANDLFNCEVKDKVENYISFYVLAFEPNKSESPLYIPKRFEEAPWTLVMEIDGKIYRPINIKMIELDTEYKAIFGKHITNFKKPYLVQFLNKDEFGNCLINKPIKLIFTHLINEICLEW